jgi:hypothetical protein
LGGDFKQNQFTTAVQSHAVGVINMKRGKSKLCVDRQIGVYCCNGFTTGRKVSGVHYIREPYRRDISAGKTGNITFFRRQPF